VDGGSYYSIPRGFAIATQIEHIDRDGKPKPGNERWQRKPLPPDLTLTNLLKVLFDAKPGFYRIIVFAVTDTKIEPQGEPLTQNAGEAVLHKGWLSLPSEIAKLPYTESYVCAGLIYEFERRGYNDATRPVSFGPPAQTQLIDAHIFDAHIWPALEH
jgi:hypothetical protein